MAFYDSSSATYDSGLRYDEVTPTTNTTNMKKVKLNLRRKNDSGLLTFSQQHSTAMDGNTNFTTPEPSVVDYQAAHDDFETKLDEANMAQQTAQQKTMAKDAARAVLETKLTKRANYVENASDGVAEVIL